MELRLCRQVKFLRLNRFAVNVLRRIVHAVAVFHREVKNTPNNTQRAVEPRRTVILAVSRRPLPAILLRDLCDVG